ncbi:MAG: hypothetical protein ACK412_04705 [Chloroherpetonaceae bacterium]
MNREESLTSRFSLLASHFPLLTSRSSLLPNNTALGLTIVTEKSLSYLHQKNEPFFPNILAVTFQP